MVTMQLRDKRETHGPSRASLIQGYLDRHAERVKATKNQVNLLKLSSLEQESLTIDRNSSGVN